MENNCAHKGLKSAFKAFESFKGKSRVESIAASVNCCSLKPKVLYFEAPSINLEILLFTQTQKVLLAVETAPSRCLQTQVGTSKDDLLTNQCRECAVVEVPFKITIGLSLKRQDGKRRFFGLVRPGTRGSQKG